MASFEILPGRLSVVEIQEVDDLHRNIILESAEIVVVLRLDKWHLEDSPIQVGDTFLFDGMRWDHVMNAPRNKGRGKR